MHAPPPLRIRNVITRLLFTLGVIAAMVLIVGWQTRQAAEHLGWDEHTYQVLYELENCLVQTLGIQSGARAFALTGQTQSLTTFESSLVKVQQSIGRLKMLVADNPAQEQRVADLARIVDEEVSVMRVRIEARRTGGLAAAAAAASDGSGHKVMQRIRGVVGTMEQAERDLLAVRSSAARADGWWTLLIVSCAGLASGLIIATAIRSIRRWLSAPATPSGTVSPAS